MEFLKIYEDFEEEENEKYELHWIKLLEFLSDKDFDLYEGQDDLENFFKETANNNDLSAEEKAESICGFMDDKWGIYDEYTEIYDFIQSLFTK